MTELRVNGRTVQVDAAPDTPLLDVLRNRLGLTGARYGCELEQCGSCMVLLDGEPAFSCVREIGTLHRHEITTVEALSDHPLIKAFLEEQAGQCGYCLTGMVITAKALLDRTRHPSREQIVAALDRNLCRCGAHARIIRAVQRAAASEVPA